jgi:lipid A 3-O-deacylase
MRKRTLPVIFLLFVLAPALHAENFLHWFDAETIYWENDNFGIGRKSDRFYTNGAKVTVLLADVDNWSSILKRAKKLRIAFCKHFCSPDQQLESVNFVFGQNFYTPQTITIAAPQPDDHPWAGWLYTGMSETIVDEGQKIQHYMEAQIGILGPGAGAQATQKYIHNDLHFSNHDPQGWHNQLKNEPTLNVLYRQSRRYGNDTRDIVPEAGGMLGTVQTYVNAGVTARLGWHMTGFPVALITPTAVPAPPPRLPHKIEAYVFVGTDGRWVPFNATLDGGLFRGGPTANGPKRFVNDIRAGVSVRIRALRFTYSVVDRSKEFDVPAGRAPKQRFGSFALSIEPLTRFRD